MWLTTEDFLKAAELFQKELDLIFDESNLNSWLINKKQLFIDKMYESSNAYLQNFELPGFKKELIDIEVSQNQLIISAKRDKSEEDGIEEKSLKYIITIPKICDVDKIESKLVDGVLTIKIPKKLEASLSKKIKID